MQMWTVFADHGFATARAGALARRQVRDGASHGVNGRWAATRQARVINWRVQRFSLLISARSRFGARVASPRRS